MCISGNRAPNSSGRTGGGAASTVDVTDTTFVWEATLFDVFESDGRFVGSVSLPPKVNPLYMRGDLVWAVAKDDNEVDFVKRYRIVWR